MIVARSGVTKIPAFADLVKVLTRSGVTVVGSVFNQPGILRQEGSNN
jgi:hypothetical protein